MDYSIQQIPNFPEYTVNHLVAQINAMLHRVGIYSRVFGRVKSQESICKKLQVKQYDGHEKKMQDIIGVRIAVYFDDDINLVKHMLTKTFECVGESIDRIDKSTFGPTRMNMVFRIPTSIMDEITFVKTIKGLPIDYTFELQIRTVLSEGWHEVEHDLRYKQQDAWRQHDDYARALNSIIATLTSCDWTMRVLFENLAHAYYIENNWLCMCRNHLRIRFADTENELQESENMLRQNHNLAKYMLKVNREKLITVFFDCFSGFPCTLKNLIYICLCCIGETSISIPNLIYEQIQDHKEVIETIAI